MLLHRWILILSLLLLTGCSKLTKENYQQLKAGMSYEEVTAIIGKATRCEDSLGTNRCVWGDENGTHVKINFISDTALLFSQKGLQ